MAVLFLRRIRWTASDNFKEQLTDKTKSAEEAKITRKKLEKTAPRVHTRNAIYFQQQNVHTD